jgi:hypothetical protein
MQEDCTKTEGKRINMPASRCTFEGDMSLDASRFM